MNIFFYIVVWFVESSFRKKLKQLIKILLNRKQNSEKN